MSIHFQPIPQKPNQITIDLPPSSSNRSYLTRRNIVIGAVGIGLTVAAVTAYFLTANNAFTETAFSTTESSTGHNLFADPTEPSRSEIMQSLHDIVRNVTTSPNGYYNCDPAFQAHWERFKECGESAYECMRNSIKLFGDLFCEPPTNPSGYIDDTSEKCENNYFALARCDI